MITFHMKSRNESQSHHFNQSDKITGVEGNKRLCGTYKENKEQNKTQMAQQLGLSNLSLLLFRKVISGILEFMVTCIKGIVLQRCI